MFDLHTDQTPIRKLFKKDALLKEHAQRNTIPNLPVAFNTFEFVVRAILGQQISVKGATTLAGRLVKSAGMMTIGNKADSTGGNIPDSLTHYFPTPEELVNLPLEKMGITGPRQRTIQLVTRAVVEGRLKLNGDQTFEDFYKDFTDIKGIGDWTAHYVGMRGLGMKDCFPSGDLGVVKAMSRGLEKNLPQKKILEIAEKWRPYRSYATLCLWNTPLHNLVKEAE
jgi:3-methyladenine DNA glycosylase/8-oxoguanine DNA glycosylase